MAGGRRDRGLYGGGNVSGARMWWRQCVKSQDVAGGRRDRGLYDGRNVSGARMWLEVGETGDSII